MSRAVDYLSRDKLAWLLVAQALVILPLLFFLPGWLWLVWGAAVYWRIQVFLGRWGAPGKLVKLALICACGLGILVSFGGKLVTESMVALLLCTFALKLLEVNAQRDARWMMMIGFVCIATQLLFSQAPQAALYSLGCCWLMLACWRSLQLTRPQPWREGIGRSAMLLLHSIPVMLVLFVALPRLGPLWAIPNQQSASTGFSDSLSPGDLGQLVLNQATAFRVEFDGEIPTSNQLYWRGMVLDHFDGRRWQLRNPWTPTHNGSSSPGPNSIHYQVIIEAHGLPWLFALATPVQLKTSPIASWINSDMLLMTRTPLQQRMRYGVVSDPDYRPSSLRLTEGERRQLLQLPDNYNPRTQALAASWRAEGLSSRQVQARALALFNREFSYTLRPPTLGQHSVDEFLFDTKRGFCEHYASSFAFLLRAAGIPARVAMGYQGGQWNPVENYLLVRQADAHAWVEVWHNKQGWQRVDPTAAVAPNRIEQGLNDALSLEEQQLLTNPVHFPLLAQMQLRWDAATYLWQRWVLSYDEQSRNRLLDRWLGGSDPWRLVLGLLLCLLLGGALLAFWLWRSQRRPPLAEEVKLLQTLEHKLALRGYTRATGEAPGKFLQRVGRAQPSLQPVLAEINRLYTQVAYGGEPEQITALKKAIKRA